MKNPYTFYRWGSHVFFFLSLIVLILLPKLFEGNENITGLLTSFGYLMVLMWLFLLIFKLILEIKNNQSGFLFLIDLKALMK